METYRGQKLEPLAESEPLMPGDRILIKFDWLINGDWFRAWQWGLLEKKLEGRKDWRVISTMFDADSLYAEIEILPQPEPELQMADLSGYTIAIIIIGLATAALISTEYYFVKRGDQELRKMGIEPTTLSEALKILGYAALVGAAGWLVKSILRR